MATVTAAASRRDKNDSRDRGFNIPRRVGVIVVVPPFPSLVVSSARKSHGSPLLENSWIPTYRPSGVGLYFREDLQRLKLNSSRQIPPVDLLA